MSVFGLRFATRPVLATIACLNALLLVTDAFLFSSPLNDPIIKAPEVTSSNSNTRDQGVAGAAGGAEQLSKRTDVAQLNPEESNDTPNLTFQFASGSRVSGQDADGSRTREQSDLRDNGALVPSGTLASLRQGTGAAGQPVFVATAVAGSSPAAGSAVDPAPSIAEGTVPLVFSVSPDGATPGQAAALQRLQRQFAETVAASGQVDSDPAYAQTWRAAQTLSDSNFEQQFGTQAFIEAQLAQYHGGAK